MPKRNGVVEAVLLVQCVGQSLANFNILGRCVVRVLEILKLARKEALVERTFAFSSRASTSLTKGNERLRVPRIGFEHVPTGIQSIVPSAFGNCLLHCVATP